MLAFVLVALPLLQTAQLPQDAAWRLDGRNIDAYSYSASGVAMDSAGATLTLRSKDAPPGSFATVAGSIRADTLRERRVHLVADLQTLNVGASASLWLRADSSGRILVFENGGGEVARGTSGPTHVDVAIYVPRGTTHLFYGLLLTGSGELTASHLRLAARPPISPTTPPVPEAKRVLDSAIALARRYSLWRDTVTWSRVESDVRAMAAGAEATADVYPAIRTLLLRLGDHHSFLMKPTAAQAFATGTQNAPPTVRVQSAGIGYVAIPAYGGADSLAAQRYVRSLYDSLAQAMLRGAGSCRWILDLRANGGGNMWPMLGGLRPFLGEGGLGSFVSAQGSSPPWHARDQVDIAPPLVLAPLESAYVAVLTGPRTGSSGEAVAIAFRGRARTRSFGGATAGLSTANRNFQLPDGSMLLITVSVDADRNGTRYGAGIEPDERIAPAIGTDRPDPQLARAVQWLSSQPCAVPRSSSTH